MKAYEMILVEEERAQRIVGIGNKPEDIEKQFKGNGEVVRIKDITEEYPINALRVNQALKDAGFSITEIKIAISALRNYDNIY